MIRKVQYKDAKEIVNIFNYYIINTTISFETEKLSVEEMESRIKEKTVNNPWIVYEENEKILGYAYVGEFSKRKAYNNTREVTIYVDKESRGKKIGTMLMKELIKICKEYKFHTLVSIITVPNEKSVMLHENFGFEKVGELKEVGYKQDKWLNVAYWQKKI